MFKNVYGLCHSAETIIPSYFQISVRWGGRPRKPFHLGTAKSKLFRVPQRPVVPIEEVEEIRRLFNNYRTQLRSIKSYLRAVHLEKVKVETASATDTELEDDLFSKCMEENVKWNAEVAKVREERLLRAARVEEEEILYKILAKEKERHEELEKVEELVREEKKRSVSYITSENIEEAIEAALAKEVDYNYSIDINGNKFYGRKTRPEDCSAAIAQEAK